ncbi:MAG: STAS/SEC14 domain-containing protein [Anaerolineae bacterium]|jgi:hypothetical protein|nr:STAS/SEC14 domain-containing protein [Anaerolineae bacterium]
MSSAVEWLRPNELVQIRYYGRVVAEDIPHGAAILDELMKEASGSVQMLIDLTGVTEVGIGLRDLRMSAPPNQPKVLWMAVVTPNAIFRFLASAAMQFSEGQYRFFATHEAALDFLKQKDPRLKDFSFPASS